MLNRRTMMQTAGSGSGLTLLASGDHVQENDLTGNMTIPVACTGTVKKILVVKDSITAGVGQMTKWLRIYDDTPEIAEAFPRIIMHKFVAASGASGSGVDGYSSSEPVSVDSVESPTTITLRRYSNNYYIKAGTYHWYIWGIAT